MRIDQIEKMILKTTECGKAIAENEVEVVAKDRNIDLPEIEM
ncbi:MAG: hypothetical protein PHP54_00095 [Clostridia bacterium]|nr:hypothetical protein [Clostridia bacterium]